MKFIYTAKEMSLTADVTLRLLSGTTMDIDKYDLNEVKHGNFESLLDNGNVSFIYSEPDNTSSTITHIVVDVPEEQSVRYLNVVSKFSTRIAPIITTAIGLVQMLGQAFCQLRDDLQAQLKIDKEAGLS